MQYKPYQWQFADAESLSSAPELTAPKFLTPAAASKTMATQNSQKNEKGVFAVFMQYLPLVQWVITILIAVSVFALSQRDSQTVQAQTIRETNSRVQNLETYIEKRKTERDKQFDEIKDKMLSKEVFDAYHKNDVDRMERMEKMLQQILESKSR